MGSEFCPYYPVSPYPFRPLSFPFLPPFAHPPKPPLRTPPLPSNTPKPRTKNQNTQKQDMCTYLQVLIRSLLVLLIHRARCSLSTHAYRDEEGKRDRDADRSIAGYFPAFAWWREGAGPVGAEGDVVCCLPSVSQVFSLQPHISSLLPSQPSLTIPTPRSSSSRLKDWQKPKIEGERI